MNDEDKRILDMLIRDTSHEYKVVVDNDNVCVVDKEEDEAVYDFEHYGYEMVLEMFKYLGVDAEMC